MRISVPADRSKTAIQLNNELVLAGFTVIAITVFYLGLSALIGVPPASSLIGHSIGVLGFVLMLATETLYSIRKRARRRPIGRMSDWLKFHIFTGIVGPYMVFLHSAWKFQGLAGVTLLLTALVVFSGFIGRYIYTAVPRTAQGVAVEAHELEGEIATARNDLHRQLATRGLRPPATKRAPRAGILGVLTRGLSRALDRFEFKLWQRRLRPEERLAAAEIARLVERQRTLEQQLASLSAARRLLALWHTIHVPIGLTLFIFAFIHAGAAMYYATLLK
jgi:hypothetical protein